MKKTKSYYIDIITNVLTKIYSDDVKSVCNIVCAQADKDYKYLYAQLNNTIKELNELKENFKKELNV